MAEHVGVEKYFSSSRSVWVVFYHLSNLQYVKINVKKIQYVKKNKKQKKNSFRIMKSMYRVVEIAIEVSMLTS